MDKVSMIIDVARKLLKVVEDIRTLADSIYAVGTAVIDGFQGEEKEIPQLTQKGTPAVTLEQVRGVLADKSRDGHTAEVRAIIQKHGADRLSEIDPEEYGAVLREAEVL